MRFVCATLAAVLVVLIPDRRDPRADEAVPAPQLVQRLIAGLDADRFGERQQCERALIGLGALAIPAVAEAAATGAPEVRVRAARIVLAIRRRELVAGFSALAQQADDQRIDLEQGMWLISRIVDPECSRERLIVRLDALAERVRNRLGPNVTPQSADPQEVVAAIRHVLFVEEEFAGNAGDYQHPDNSSLARVLETKKGLPILLSHVVVAVADRLRVPIVGIPIPGCYMVKYEAVRAPAAYAGEDIIFDPFEGGRVLTLEELQQVVVDMGYGFDPVEFLTPSRRRATLERMLTNLVTHLHLAGRHGEAALAQECLWIMDDGVDEQ